MPNARMLKVFLSYSRKNSRKVNYFYKKLNEERWIKPWIDDKNLSTGEDWKNKIPDMIENDTHVVLVFLSNAALDKIGYFQSEMRIAVEKAKQMPEGEIFILPIRLEDCKIPYILNKYHCEDYYKNTKRSYSKILKSLEEKAKKNGILTDAPPSKKLLVELILDIEYANIREARVTASNLLNIDKRDVFWNEEEEMKTRPITLFVRMTERAERDLKLEVKNNGSEYRKILRYIDHNILRNVNDY